MPDVSYVKVDTSQLKFWLDELERRGRNLKEINKGLAALLIEQVDDNFATAGHGKWRELAPSTHARRRKKGAGAQILQDTGRLAASINMRNTDVTEDLVEVFTNVKYGKYHVSPLPRTKIPLRDFLEIDFEKFLEEGTEILVSEITG
jgi:phage gpG-like protein